jgi:hypothetical protein
MAAGAGGYGCPMREVARHLRFLPPIQRAPAEPEVIQTLAPDPRICQKLFSSSPNPQKEW